MQDCRFFFTVCHSNSEKKRSNEAGSCCFFLGGKERTESHNRCSVIYYFVCVERHTQKGDVHFLLTGEYKARGILHFHT